MTLNDFNLISRADFIQRLNKQKLKFKSGTKVSYSNIGYSVLAYIIEEVTGKKYEDYMQETFFIPLGMTKTGYEHFDWSLDSVAVGYKGARRWDQVFANIKKMNGNYWNLIGNGGIHMDINNLYKWYLAMKYSKIITEEMFSLLTYPYEKCGPKTQTCYQSYAWVVLARDQGKDMVAITHSGGNDILYADFWWYVKEDIFIGMLTNNSKYPAEDVLKEIRAILRN